MEKPTDVTAAVYAERDLTVVDFIRNRKPPSHRNFTETELRIELLEAVVTNVYLVEGDCRLAFKRPDGSYATLHFPDPKEIREMT